MIDNKDITVVVQGPVVASPDRKMDSGITVRCLASVRQFLPGARIILSTWQGQPVEDLDYDELILNPDPGPNINRYRADGQADTVNNNRQLVSSLNGLKRVKTRYAMKLRSDNYLVSDAFKALQQHYCARAPAYRFLKERVVVNNTFTRQYAKGLPVVFHACDFFYFGLAEDVLALWDIPLFADLPFDESAFGREQHDGYPYYMPDCTQRFWLKALQQFDSAIQLQHLLQHDAQLQRISDLCYANNLVIGEPARIGLALNSRFTGGERANSLASKITYISHFDWQRLYRKYCDPEFVIPQALVNRFKFGVLRGLLLPPKWLEGQLRLRRKLAKSRKQGSSPPTVGEQRLRS